MESIPSIALGTWSWGSGMAGGDQVFGNHTDAGNLKSVFDAAYNAGLTEPIDIDGNLARLYYDLAGGL